MGFFFILLYLIFQEQDKYLTKTCFLLWFDEDRKPSGATAVQTVRVKLYDIKCTFDVKLISSQKLSP